MKNIGVFVSENFQFLEVKFSIYLNRRVFVMYEPELSFFLQDWISFFLQDCISFSYKIASEDTGHSVGSKGSEAPLSGQRKLWSDCADAQVDLSLRWAHMQYCRKWCAPAYFKKRTSAKALMGQHGVGISFVLHTCAENYNTFVHFRLQKDRRNSILCNISGDANYLKINLASQQTNTDAFANSGDSDETAH